MTGFLILFFFLLLFFSLIVTLLLVFFSLPKHIYTALDFLFYVALLLEAFDTEQLLDCIKTLKSGQPYQVPIYDFKKHRRCSDSFRLVRA